MYIGETVKALRNCKTMSRHYIRIYIFIYMINIITWWCKIVWLIVPAPTWVGIRMELTNCNDMSIFMEINRYRNFPRTCCQKHLGFVWGCYCLTLCLTLHNIIERLAVLPEGPTGLLYISVALYGMRFSSTTLWPAIRPSVRKTVISCGFLLHAVNIICFIYIYIRYYICRLYTY